MSEYGSLDLTLALPAFDSGEWVGISLDVSDSSQEADGHLSVRVHEDLIQLVSEPSETVLDQVSMTAILPDPEALFATSFLPIFEVIPDFIPTDGENFGAGDTLRIVFQNSSVTLYLNDVFLHNFFIPNIAYPELEPVVTVFRSDGWAVSPTVGVSIVELDDWREAIYIETEAVAASGISSLIQERPIIVLGRSDGSIDFFYEKDEDPIEIEQHIVREHTESERNISSASDALIEGRDITAISYPDYADEVGYKFATIQLGSLDSGEKKAARALLKRGMESAVEHYITMRPDLRIEPNDVLWLRYTASATGTYIDRLVIANSVNVRLTHEKGSMTIQGRRKL
jgi:hypothetical protein